MPKKVVKRQPARAKKATPTKRAKAAKPAVVLGKEIGRVVAFFRIPVVAVIKVKKEPLMVGEAIWIKGHTTDLKLTVASMQIDHQPVTEVRKGQEAGIKLAARARRGDRVYRLPA